MDAHDAVAKQSSMRDEEIAQDATQGRAGSVPCYPEQPYVTAPVGVVRHGHETGGKIRLVIEVRITCPRG